MTSALAFDTKKKWKRLFSVQFWTKLKSWKSENIDLTVRPKLLFSLGIFAVMYLQLPLRQWGAVNVYLLVFSSCKVNIAENPIAVMGL